MITDEQLDELPEDAEAAFVVYEKILREAVEAASTNDTYVMQRRYMAHVIGFIKRHALEIPVEFDVPSDGDEFREYFWEAIQIIDASLVEIRLRLSEYRKQNISILRLSADFKVQIGTHLTAIRKIVDEATMSENKRDAIYRRLAKLQEEVDRDRTRTEAAMGLWLEITSAIGKGAENLDPAIERMQKIVRIFSLAKDESEPTALPAPKEQKRLPSPKQVERRKAAAENQEPEIPF